MPFLRISSVRAFALPAAAALWVAAVALFLLLSAPEAGAQAAERTTPRGEQTPLNLPETRTVEDAAGGGGLARTIVGLLVVIGVIYGITWILKQVKRSQAGDPHGTGLAAVSSLPLGTGRSVQLVRAGNEYLLLGIADGGLTTLRTYTEEQAQAAGLLDDEDDFIELGRRRPEGPATIGSVTADAVERLRKLTVRR